MSSRGHSRREFLKTSLLGGAAALAAPGLVREAAAGLASPASRQAEGQLARVALTTGNDRADMTFQALRRFQKEIASAIGNKRVVVKPNLVSIDRQLAATHVDNLEGIFEFLQSIGKSKQAVIAESAAGGSALDGFEHFGYGRVANKYGVRMIDLDTQAFEVLTCIDEREQRRHPVRVSRWLTDPNNYVISASKLKTHDAVVATLSLKNIVMGAPLKLRERLFVRSDKHIVHGGGPHAINYNLASLAKRLHPDLAVVDGFEGMQGNGPVGGTPVAHRVCVVGQDWLAADRVGLELMGIAPGMVGYLNYCARDGMGEWDLQRIEVLGPPLRDHIRRYRLHDEVQEQLRWMQPVRRG